MNKLFYILILSLVFYSCGISVDNEDNKSIKKDGNTIISGILKNSSGKSLVLESLSATNVSLIDTIQVNNDGSFNLIFNANEMGFYRVYDSKSNFCVLIIDANDSIQLNADATNLEGTYTVSNSFESERLRSLNKYMYMLYVRRDSLTKEIRNHQTNRDVSSYANAIEYQSVIMNQFSSFIKDFIDESPGSLSSLAAVEKLDPEAEIEYFKKVANGLNESLPNSGYTKGIMQRITTLNKLAIGTEAPEIELNNPEGIPIKLSSLRGKVVLIDFWASWCKPCRAENPNVVKTYNKYKSKGFDVFSVSLDKAKNNWTQAIQKDGLVWSNHVSDLGYWNSAVVPIYNIKGIPFTVLVDKDGKIIAKNLRGPALEAKLKEVLGA